MSHGGESRAPDELDEPFISALADTMQAALAAPSGHRDGRSVVYSLHDEHLRPPREAKVGAEPLTAPA